MLRSTENAVISIRIAEKNDAAEIARLAHSLAHHEGVPSHFQEKDFVRDGFGERAAFHTLVAEASQGEQHEVIGFLMYYAGYDLATAARGHHLNDMVVDARWRGRGVGQSLVSELAKRTLSMGGSWVSWTVLRQNQPAQKFYQALGASTVNVDFMAWGEMGLKHLAKR